MSNLYWFTSHQWKHPLGPEKKQLRCTKTLCFNWTVTFYLSFSKGNGPSTFSSKGGFESCGTGTAARKMKGPSERSQRWKEHLGTTQFASLKASKPQKLHALNTNTGPPRGNEFRLPTTSIYFQVQTCCCSFQGNANGWNIQGRPWRLMLLGWGATLVVQCGTETTYNPFERGVI